MVNLKLYETYHELTKRYPEKKISEKDLVLYENLFESIKIHNLTVREIFEQLGFLNDEKDYFEKQEETILKNNSSILNNNSSVEKIKNQLIQMYPNKQVTKLFKRNLNFYKTISDEANNVGLGIVEFIENLGFDYFGDKNKISEEDVKREYITAYPNKEISNISTNKVLYQRLRKVVFSKKTDINTLLKDWGFKINRKNDLEKKSLELLLDLYPNKKVKNLYKYSTLYNKVLKIASCGNKDLRSYLKEHGFEYEYKSKKMTDDEIETQLINLYPDKVVRKLSNHNKLYYTIFNRSKKLGLTIEDILNILGFTQDKAN
jgi:hypothetical protein